MTQVVVSIHQPNYVPWLGYFRKIALSDVFVFFDNVQMPGGKSFVSRNAIKTASGRHWLTVPVNKKLGTPIAQVPITDQAWTGKHLKTLRLNYGYSQWLDILDTHIEPVLSAGHKCLADLNTALVEALVRAMGFDQVNLLRASELNLKRQGADSIPEILRVTGATIYATGSGSGTQRHLETDKLSAMGIETRFVSAHFSDYQQRFGDFEGNLSILDALFNIGPEATAELLLSERWSEPVDGEIEPASPARQSVPRDHG